MDNPNKSQNFPSTHWSLILDGTKRDQCIEELAIIYWTPIYWFARKFGYNENDAQDLVQDLFYQLQFKDLISKADPEKGKFRTFLIAILKNLCKQKRDYSRRKFFLSLECRFGSDDGETYLLEPTVSTEDIFNREWAIVVVNNALSQLHKYCEGKDERELAFQAFEMRYLDDQKSHSIAESINRSPEWVHEKVYRLKEKYAEYIKNIIKETLTEEESVEDEISEIMSYL